MTKFPEPQQESDTTVVAIVDFLARRVDAKRRQLLDQLGDGQREGRTELDVNDLALNAELVATKARLALHRAEMVRRTSAGVTPPMKVVS